MSMKKQYRITRPSLKNEHLPLQGFTLITVYYVFELHFLQFFRIAMTKENAGRTSPRNPRTIFWDAIAIEMEVNMQARVLVDFQWMQ